MMQCTTGCELDYQRSSHLKIIVCAHMETARLVEEGPIAPHALLRLFLGDRFDHSQFVIC